MMVRYDDVVLCWQESRDHMRGALRAASRPKVDGEALYEELAAAESTIRTLRERIGREGIKGTTRKR